MSQDGSRRVTRYGNPKSPSRIPLSTPKSPSRIPLSAPKSPSRIPLSTPKSPSRIQFSTPTSLARKRPAPFPEDKKMAVGTPSKPAATPSVSGFRRLDFLAKAEARNRSPGQGQLSTGTDKAGSKAGIPWVDKHLPKSLDDLFVHKKKMEEVMNWLGRTIDSSPKATRSKGNNICVLSGPAGSGKTATMHLVGKTLEFEVKEWVNPMSLSTFQFKQGEDQGPKDEVHGRNQVEEFVDFLFRTSQYKPLTLKGKVEKKHRLVLVEDIPNTFYREPNVFHDMLRKYSSTGQIPLVFVFSDSSSGDHSMYKMFPKNLLTDLNICNISFNAVASTLMSKFLLEICKRESIPTDKSVIEEIAVTSNGDLRCAVNNLQFSLTKESFSGSNPKGPFKKPAAKRAKKGDTKVKSALSDIQQKDNTIQLFRALGKVLYAKRDEGTISEHEVLLPADMESERRLHPLIEDPENICDKIEVSANTFVGFLHQNYPAFYGSLEEMRTASEYLSISDFILKGWKFDESGGGRSYKVREVKDLVGTNIAVRGIMHSNSKRVSVGWKPLTKPLVSDLDRFTKESVESTRQVLFHFRELQTTLFTESIPFYAKLLQKKPSIQIAVSKEILEKGLFKTKFTRVATLDEKETVEESSEVPEDEKETQEEKMETNSSENDADVKKSALDIMEEADGAPDDDEQFIIEEYDD